MTRRPADPHTIAARTGVDSDTAHGAVMPPLYLSSNYSFAGFDQKRKYDYSRSGNPTRDVPPIAAGITNYVTLADDHMLIEFQVQRRDPTPATCVLRARARDSFDVGYAVVELPTAEGRTSHSFDMRTAYRPFVGELLGCSIDGPPDVSGSQFRPGVVPPEQPWTAPSR